MSKRLAENQLTPEELARQLQENAQGASDSKHELADKVTMEGRKVVRVKRHLPNDNVATEEVKGGVFKLIGSLDTKVSKEDTVVVEGVPLFKPFNFSNSTFGGQTIPVKASEEKMSEAPLFVPAKPTGNTIFDKKPEPAAAPVEIKEKEKKEEEPSNKAPLFGSASSNQPLTSLFVAKDSTQTPTFGSFATTAASGLFGSGGGSLFNATTKLFGSSETAPVASA